jgi:formate dehydrogenase iron-sulfur subunit
VSRVYISADSASIALGAEAVARAFAGAGAEVVRTGPRGLFWLEPLVEVETAAGRLAYGPVTPKDAAAVLAGTHPSLGAIENHPAFKAQTRIVFARCGLIDPLAPPAFAALAAARAMGAEAVLKAVSDSGLRGRGGAGFPAGIKWRTVADAPGADKVVVCNADEGDSGTFADRMLMEGDPFTLIEGMAIAAFAVGARQGFVYGRSEYPRANRIMAAAIETANALNPDFRLELRIGAGAYVCGEETALLESLEGKRGQVRAKPPLPAHVGAFGRPTVVNNVLTFGAVPWIIAHGAEAHAALGHGRSRGAQPVQLSGDVKHPGLYEVPFGLTLGEIVEGLGGGTASGGPVRAVQCGGPLGAYFPPALFDTPYDYEAFAAADGLVGHGGIVVLGADVDMAQQARFAFEFCALESCGKCTPCRIGAVRGLETVDKVIAGEAVEANLALIADLCHTMKLGSLCALGGFTPYPVLSAVRWFGEDFRK